VWCLYIAFKSCVSAKSADSRAGERICEANSSPTHNPSIFSAAFSALRDIISNPGQFFSTLGRGIVAGFKQFAENIVKNLKVLMNSLLRTLPYSPARVSAGECFWQYICD